MATHFVWPDLISSYFPMIYVLLKQSKLPVFHFRPPSPCYVHISATALVATACLRGHEFCVLSSVLEFWLMVYGSVFEKCVLGGGSWSPTRHRFYGPTPDPAY